MFSFYKYCQFDSQRSAKKIPPSTAALLQLLLLLHHVLFSNNDAISVITLAFNRLDFLIGPLIGPLSLYSNITFFGKCLLPSLYLIYLAHSKQKSSSPKLFSNTSLHDLLLHLYEQQCLICYLRSGDRALESIRRQKTRKGTGRAKRGKGEEICTIHKVCLKRANKGQRTQGRDGSSKGGGESKIQPQDIALVHRRKLIVTACWRVIQ